MHIAPQPPNIKHSLTEIGRAGLEATSTLIKLKNTIGRAKQGDGHTVLTLPGYGGADGSMKLLRHFLNQSGFNPAALELGRNLEQSDKKMTSMADALAFRDGMVESVAQRIESLYVQNGAPISLVGWSLGGIYAVDAISRVPHAIKQVITLGTPFGDPRGTVMWPIMSKLNGNDTFDAQQHVDEWVRLVTPPPADVPITVYLQ